MPSSLGFKGGEEGPDLHDWLDGQRSRPEWPVLRGIIASLLDALAAFHARTGPHGAISPRTIRVVAVTPPHLEIISASLVLAEIVPDPGALAYVAPEMRDGGPPTLASDMFGVAAVAYRIVTGRTPEAVSGDSPIAKHLTAAHLAGDDYRSEFLAAIDATLVTAPNERLTIDDWRGSALPLTAFANKVSTDGLGSQTGTLEATAQPSISSLTSRSRRAGQGGVNRLLWGIAAGAALTTVLGTWLLVDLVSVFGPGLVPPSGVGPAGGKAAAEVHVPARQTTHPEDAASPVAASAGRLAASAPAPPGKTMQSPFRDCDDCPEMVVIEPGTVRMRLVPPGSLESRDFITTLTQPFAVGRYELTVGEFRAFAEATGFAPTSGCYVRNPNWRLDARLSWRNPGYPQDDRHPVACVSFEDAKAYLAWLSGRTGRSYRLLTDAEWHLIASSPDVPQERGAGQCRFANGADQTAHDAEPGWSTADCSDGYHYTAPVGSFVTTGAGLSDLFGNVWEWVDSCAPDFSRPTPVFAACGSDTPRILRGGSWNDRPEMLALDARLLSPPQTRDQIVGVRIAREVSPCETKVCPSDAELAK